MSQPFASFSSLIMEEYKSLVSLSACSNGVMGLSIGVVLGPNLLCCVLMNRVRDCIMVVLIVDTVEG
jgi:hypothetical protein